MSCLLQKQKVKYIEFSRKMGYACHDIPKICIYEEVSIMSHLANAIRMMVILKGGRKTKTRELAQEIGVDVRTIRRYKIELGDGGVIIKSEAGKDGGYYWDQGRFYPDVWVNEKEYLSLQLTCKHLAQSKNVLQKDMNSVLHKVRQTFDNKKENSMGLAAYSSKVPLMSANEDEERSRMLYIHGAAINKKKIFIKYNSLASGVSERIIDPYLVFLYKGDNYFAGFCHEKGKVVDFKISRVLKYRVLDEGFEIIEGFSVEEYEKNCLGIHKGEELDLKVKIRHPMSQIVREKIWVENQKIEELGDGAIMFCAKMRGEAEIKSWVLGMGSAAEVLEPKGFREKVRAELENLRKIYM